MIKQANELTFNDKKFSMILYGAPGVGKTTLALSAPSPVLIDFDKGISRVKAYHRKLTIVCRTYEEVLTDIKDPAIKDCETIVIDTGGKVIAASQAGKYKTLCQCIGLAMLMLPMWSLADGMNTTPLWMTVYYTITYALIYLALILCLYSGGEYLVNTFGGRKKTAKSEKETK